MVPTVALDEWLAGPRFPEEFALKEAALERWPHLRG